MMNELDGATRINREAASTFYRWVISLSPLLQRKSQRRQKPWPQRVILNVSPLIKSGLSFSLCSFPPFYVSHTSPSWPQARPGRQVGREKSHPRRPLKR